MNKKALSKISYGMFIVGSASEGKSTAFVANAVFQVASIEPLLGISVSKEIYSHELISISGLFSISVLEKDAPMDLINKLGFYSGRNSSKTHGLKIMIKGGIPIILESACAFYTAKVVNRVDCGTHTLFIGQVIDAEMINDTEVLTYADYKKNKGATPRFAPTFNPLKTAAPGD